MLFFVVVCVCVWFLCCCFWCMCVCMCVCVHVHAYMHMHVCAHTCMRACMCVKMVLPVCVCVCVCVHAYMCVKTLNKNFLSMTSMNMQGIWMVTLQQKTGNAMWGGGGMEKELGQRAKRAPSWLRTLSISMMWMNLQGLPTCSQVSRHNYYCWSHMNTSTHKKIAPSMKGNSTLV